MSDKTIRFGFLGAGAISHWAASVVNAHPQARVVAVQDLHDGRARDLAKTFDIPRVHTSAAELFANPEVDAVYIALPNKFHAPMAVEALEAGKHVMVEKPFAKNAEEASSVIETANRHGLVLTVGMNQRFEENSQKFHTLVEKGVFGEIYHAKACWLRRSGIPKLGTWFGSKDLAGGGCLYDIGVHVLDLCLYVLNDFNVKSVFGATYSKFGPRGLGEGSWGHSDRADLLFEVEDFVSGLIRMASGATVSLDVTWARHSDLHDRVEVELFGTEAGGQVYAGKIFRHDAGLGCHYTLEKPQAKLPYPHKERFHNLINHILGTEDLCVTPDQALMVQRILDALAVSAATGDSIPL
ncbi:MAG: Gfo/Idh/MocA family oxidoreductase [Terrimicrobiaceae bacterium]